MIYDTGLDKPIAEKEICKGTKAIFMLMKEINTRGLGYTGKFCLSYQYGKILQRSGKSFYPHQKQEINDEIDKITRQLRSEAHK